MAAHDLTRSRLALRSALLQIGDRIVSTLFVIETETDRYLGTLAVEEGALVVHSGLVGRPPIIDLDTLLSIVPADDHPDVEVVEPVAAGLTDITIAYAKHAEWLTHD
jgi:hypothetical protein